MGNRDIGRLAGSMLITVCLLASGSLHAQKFNAGIFGGINASQVDRDGYGGYNKLSLTGGVFVNREFSQNFYWQMELKYGGRGVYYLGDILAEDFRLTRFRYAELPLSVQYIHEDKFQAGIGFSPDVLISFAAYDIQKNELPQAEKLGGNRRFGLNAFAGVRYWILPTISVGLRFSYSVIPYSLREGASVRYLDSGYFHNVLSLTASYKILHP